jgi:dCTP deaminase
VEGEVLPQGDNTVNARQRGTPITRSAKKWAARKRREFVNMAGVMLISLMPKSDRWIREISASGMIEPFDESRGKKGVVSWGVSAYGYDMRVADEFKVFTPRPGVVIDPKDARGGHFIDFKGPECVIPANSFVLGRSVEYFRIPRDVLVICFGKSTYARCGIIVNVTPLEPEWEGHVTICIANTAPAPARIYSNEGIAQAVFLPAEEVCATSYADKSGKYQAQKKITLPRT